MERQKILEKVDVPLEHEMFCRQVFSAIGDPFDAISSDADASEIQESCSIRNTLITRELAISLVNDEGKIDEEALSQTIINLENRLYVLGPDWEHDAKRNEYLLQALKLLQSDKATLRALMRISKPYMHKFADQVIRDTLQISPKILMTDALARRAALSAMLAFLRQNVGSCFATAPAILIHDEQCEVFLNDIQELLSTGRLKRTFGGVEYSVPLSSSSGSGDLKKKALAEGIELWRSPGLLAAFEAVGIIDPSLLKAEKQTKCKSLIPKGRILVSAEEIIVEALQDHFQLSEREIKEFEERPKGIQSFLMQAPKTHKYDQYLVQLELAKSAFKGLSDNALLKSWEFSLASFAEIKSEFTRWNLYSSLGFQATEPGGIGECLVEILQRKLEECNEKVRQHQAEYEMVYQQLQFAQTKLKNSATEKEAQWNRMEYQTKLNEFNLQEELRHKYHLKAKRYANLYHELLDIYDRLFPEYFQEVYDADIQEVKAGPYDDSPAGFRLVYKHGRSNTSQWTKIENHVDFIDALANFFTATETEIAGLPEMKYFQDDMTEITTAIVNHVRSKRFLETAFNRMAIAHHSRMIENPLENLDKIEKKPWVYTSGGAMNTLVSAYFRRNEKPTEATRWVDNPMELLVFFIDCIKEMPEKIQESFETSLEKSMLVHSPTHAFLLKPGYPLFSDAWKIKEFTYTWVRDNHVRNMEQFCKKIYLDDEKMRFIIEKLQKKVPITQRHYFGEVFGSLGGSMQVKDFRQHLVNTIDSTIGLHYRGLPVLSTEEIDSMLFNLLPIFPSYKLRELIPKIVYFLPGLKNGQHELIMQLYEELSGKIMAPKLVSSKGLVNIIKALVMLVIEDNHSKYDYHKLITQAAQKNECALPAPIIFADTNWVKDYFAFAVNPGTGQLELWRTDYTGATGYPMQIWEPWLNGSRKDPKWGLYTRPTEYVFR